MRRGGKLVALLVCTLFVLAMVMTACAGRPQSSDNKGKVILRTAIITDPGTLNPILAASTAELQVSRILFDSLTKLDPKTFEPEPALAKSWEVSPDGLTWTFDLRDDVKWHDGQPFTAEDVKFSFDQMMDSKVNSPNRANFRSVKEVKVISPTRVQFILEAPYASLATMVANRFGIAPKHLLEGKDINTYTEFNKKNPVGTGPFKLAEYKPGEYFRLVRNEHYYLSDVKADEIYLKIIPDANTQIAQLKTGELDLIPFDIANLSAVSGSNDIELVSGTYPRWYAFHLNCSHPLFQDKRVRQAISYAIDRQAIIDNVFAGHATVATGPIIPALDWAYNGDVRRYPYDPEKAKALLAEAGWKDTDGDGVLDKDGKPFKFEMSVIAGNSTVEKSSTIIHQNLKAIGLSPTMKSYEFSAFVKEVRDNREGPSMFQSYFCWMTPEAEPDGIYQYFHSSNAVKGSNFTVYRNPEVDRLLELGRASTDRETRKQAYYKLQEILAEEVARVFIAYPEEIWAVRKGVGGVYPSQPYQHAYDWTVTK